MAGVALLDEDRPGHVGLEEFDALWGSVGRTCLGHGGCARASARNAACKIGDLWTRIGVAGTFRYDNQAKCGGGGLGGVGADLRVR